MFGTLDMRVPIALAGHVIFNNTNAKTFSSNSKSKVTFTFKQKQRKFLDNSEIKQLAF